jgi:outer membrane protein TolC
MTTLKSVHRLNQGLCLVFSALFLTTSSFGKEALSLESFLSQVKRENPGLNGALLSSQGAELRQNEGSLLVSPMVFSEFKLSRDAKISQISFLGFDALDSKTFSIGVSQKTLFGLDAKLHYDIFSLYYANPVSLFTIPGFSSGGIQTSYANASPVLEISQSLWSNSFGKSTQANQDLHEAQALASNYAAKFQAKTELSMAEGRYWALAAARQAVQVQKEALDRAQKIYTWNQRRVRLHLADPSDELQAEALMQSRKLDLLAAQNQVREASRGLNSARNIDSDAVQEDLPALDAKLTDGMIIPTRTAVREDIKAAQQASRAAVAGAVIAEQTDRPTLDVFGSFSLNGQPAPSAGVPAGFLAYNNAGDAMGASFSFNRPSFAVGLRFSASLDFGTACRSREGWRLEQVAAEKSLDKKQFDHDQEWKNLTESWTEATNRLELSKKLETIQAKKLEAERSRLQKGRTTTYQVLLFEQDYLLTQLARIRDQSTLLNLMARMKTFGETL